MRLVKRAVFRPRQHRQCTPIPYLITEAGYAALARDPSTDIPQEKRRRKASA